MDVTKSQELAQKYKINTSFLSKQLPTLILFKDGRELVRRPLVSDKNRLIAFVFNQVSMMSSSMPAHSFIRRTMWFPRSI